MTADHRERQSGYADGRRGINWPAAAAALGLQALFAVMLMSLGIVAHGEKHERLFALSVRQQNEAPAAPSKPASPPREVKQAVQTPPQTEIVAPQPKVDLQPKPGPAAAAPTEPSDQGSPAASASTSAQSAPSGSSGPMKVSNLSSNLLSGAAPSYPMGSRRKREEGTVVLRVVVSPEGRVAEISVHQSSGYSALDEAALGAVRKWRWSPTMRDGRPISITGLVRIPFTLRNS